MRKPQPDLSLAVLSFVLLLLLVLFLAPILIPTYGVTTTAPPSSNPQEHGWASERTSSLVTVPPSVGQAPQAALWQINDTIIPTIGKVDWTEVRYSSSPSPVIRLGYWYEFHQRENFIGFNDIFFDLDERFNWTRVNSAWLKFPSWEAFVQNITANPAWWLEWSWNLNSIWYGISTNRTVVQATMSGNTARVRIWGHVTNVAEYLMGYSFGAWLVFDLYSVSFGKMEAYEYYYDSTSSDRKVYVHFTAPSTILRQEGDTYTSTIMISPRWQNATSDPPTDRRIFIVMPPQSEVKTLSPAETGLYTGNIATFTLPSTKRLPFRLTVTSGPHIKEMTELIIENLTSPDRIVAMVGLVVGISSGSQGLRMLRRRRTYNKTIQLLVRVFDDNKSDSQRLVAEMGNITSSIFRLFIENKITDEQFEKLLSRRDDFLRRAGA